MPAFRRKVTAGSDLLRRAIFKINNISQITIDR
jgi:hypothetical protein